MKSFTQLEFQRLVVVANRLPFKFVPLNDTFVAEQNSGGLVSAVLALSENKLSANNKASDILWIGTGDIPEKYENPKGFELANVEVPKSQYDEYYEGFSNDTIWPLFHYFPSIVTFNQVTFQSYMEVNKLFAHKINELLQPNDLVWIHDYQLMALPAMIRENNPDANIGFFLHIPFPSYEIFRLLPRKWSEAILKGIIGADLIGFHTNDYTQHFIKSVKRTLGYDCTGNIINTGDRIARADAFPISIDYDKFHNQDDPKIIDEKHNLHEQLRGNKLIFSVDRLDYTKGILKRLLAYEFFLDNYPNWQENVVFNMVVIPSRDNIPRYKDMKNEIEATVGRINGKFSNLSWRPVIYQYKSLSFHELLALYATSDVGLITPLRDGMNLVAKEYIASQTDRVGMLILSEMAGASVELTEALIINPTDIEEVAESINIALEMPKDEKLHKIQRMQQRIRDYNVYTWANDFFSQASKIYKQQMQLQARYIDPKINGKISEAYQEASSRIIFLDYDGTLIPFAKYPEQALLSNDARKLITSMASDARNKIVIISGRDKSFLENQFTDMNLTLVAEHGLFIKHPYETWKSLVRFETGWKDKVFPVLRDYVDRCSGSFIEEKMHRWFGISGMWTRILFSCVSMG
ncbi:MAG: bifunctional alpha,alpha-trehalose-phosphate synthase (UDP-forming)/trehalose-phosphatase [Bacteroidales bacterium]|nr:bifunctional alpha,alpha-trehalose-phosphate synthase (UDP-forming)/trehalose-phosphatase [Bacteroidales bacterium]